MEHRREGSRWLLRGLVASVALKVRNGEGSGSSGKVRAPTLSWGILDHFSLCLGFPICKRSFWFFCSNRESSDSLHPH